MELLQEFYETTLEALKDAKNDRLWFKTNTKLGKLYFDRGEYNKLAKILKQLHQSCQVRLFLIKIINTAIICIIYFHLQFLQLIDMATLMVKGSEVI